MRQEALLHEGGVHIGSLAMTDWEFNDFNWRKVRSRLPNSVDFAQIGTCEALQGGFLVCYTSHGDMPYHVMSGTAC